MENDTRPAEQHGPGPVPTERYRGMPVVFLKDANGVTRPAPFLMNTEELAGFFRLHDSRTRFPAKAILRYRRLGLDSVRVGRRRWFRLDDVLRFLDRQQRRLGAMETCE